MLQRPVIGEVWEFSWLRAGRQAPQVLGGQGLEAPTASPAAPSWQASWSSSTASGGSSRRPCHQPSAQPDLCDSGQWMYQIYGQLACNPAFYSGHRTNEGHHLLSVHPGRDQVHCCKRRDRQGKLDPASSIAHNCSVPTLTSLNKELYRSSSASARCGTST